MATRPTLASLLQRQRAATVADFVAAVYAARGHDTAVDGRVAVVDGQRYTVVAAGLVGRLRDSVDRRTGETARVVAVDASRAAALESAYDAPVLTPPDLDDVLRYGLERQTADALVQEWFDRSLDDIQPRPRQSSTAKASDSAGAAPANTGTAAPAGVDSASSSGLSRSLSTGLVVAFLVVLVAVTPAALGGELVGFGSDGSATTSSGVGAGADEAGVANEPRPTARPSSNETLLAPGLGANGVTDAERLAASHAAVLANQSYTWTLTYVENVNGNESGRATERVTVESAGVYASRVRTDGFLSSRGPISYRSSYADGTNRYTPSVDGYDATSLDSGDVGRQERRAQQYYSVLLDGARTRIVGRIPHGPPLYVVEIEGAQSRTVRNYTARAHISPDGVVRYYTGSYCFYSLRDDDGGTCLSVTMQYSAVNDTSVDPPSWYTENGTENASTVTPTVTSTSTPTPMSTSTSTPTPTSTSTPTPTSTSTPTSTASSTTTTPPA